MKKVIVNADIMAMYKTLNSMKNVSFKDIMFKHSYYELYKDYGNLKLLKSLTKKV